MISFPILESEYSIGTLETDLIWISLKFDCSEAMNTSGTSGHISGFYSAIILSLEKKSEKHCYSFNGGTYNI